jgi:hypothetical protein
MLYWSTLEDLDINIGQANGIYPGFEDPLTDSGAQSFQTSPPEYPSPWMDGSGDWADAYRRAQNFVRGLTLTEKVNLTTGVWKFKVISPPAILTPRIGRLGR